MNPQRRRCAPRRISHNGHFHFGAERDAYEAQWTDAAYDRLTAILAALPIHWRFFVKTEIFRRMQVRAGAEGIERRLYRNVRALPRPAALLGIG